MSMKVGELVFNVKANTAHLQTDLAKAKTMLQGMQTAVPQLAPVSGLSSMLGPIAAGTAALTAMATALSTATAMSINLASSMQSAEASYKVLLGSTEKAKAMLGDMKDFAAKTPFGFTDMVKNGQLLLAYGLTADQIMPTVKALGDVALGDSEKFNRLATAFGQVAAKGRLMGGEAMQMREAGFNPLEYIAKRTGETMAELEKRMEAGGISVREVALAFQDATEGAGRYAGSMDEASRTLEGSTSALKDAMEDWGRSMGSYVVPPLTDIVQGMTRMLEFAEIFSRGGGIAGFFLQSSGGTLASNFFEPQLMALEGWRRQFPETFAVLRGMFPVMEGVRTGSEEAAAEIQKLGEVFADIPKQAELTKEELKDLKKTLDDFDDALKERAKEREKLYKDAERIFERTRTPLERFAKEIADAQALFNDGWLSSDTFDRELKRMEAELASFNEAAIQGNSAKREYSAEAFTSVERGRREAILGEASKEEIRVLREMAATLKEIAGKKEPTPAVKHVKGRF